MIKNKKMLSPVNIFKRFIILSKWSAHFVPEATRILEEYSKHPTSSVCRRKISKKNVECYKVGVRGW